MDVSRKLAHPCQLLGRLLPSLANPYHRIQEEASRTAFGEAIERCAPCALEGDRAVRDPGSSGLGDYLCRRLPLCQVIPGRRLLSARFAADRCHQFGTDRLQHGVVDRSLPDQFVLGTLRELLLPDSDLSLHHRAKPFASSIA